MISLRRFLRRLRARFLINTVRPLIDRQYLTVPDRLHAGIVGSSMGGLISLYAFDSRSVQ